jgi:hypothetical protein
MTGGIAGAGSNNATSMPDWPKTLLQPENPRFSPKLAVQFPAIQHFVASNV